jgi:hypothetical protein
LLEKIGDESRPELMRADANFAALRREGSRTLVGLSAGWRAQLKAAPPDSKSAAQGNAQAFSSETLLRGLMRRQTLEAIKLKADNFHIP